MLEYMAMSIVAVSQWSLQVIRTATIANVSLENRELNTKHYNFIGFSFNHHLHAVSVGEKMMWRSCGTFDTIMNFLISGGKCPSF